MLRFEDVIENKNICKSSVIGYKVKKHVEKRTAIQTFYLEGHKNNFIDNQVAYDKRYFRVSELRVVVEVHIHTEQLSLYPRKVFVNFEIEPSIQVISMYMLTNKHTTDIFSTCYSFKRRAYSQQFFFVSFGRNSVNHIEKIEKILEPDLAFFENLRLADFIDDKGLARFFSRSNTGNFEAYRIETKPEKYEDFAPGFIGVFNNYEF